MKCKMKSEAKKGKRNPMWKGGRVYAHGYIRVFKSDSKGAAKNYVYEHRFIMEQYLKRKLEDWEWVHHKNGIKTDNRIENLEIVISKKHFGQIRCPYCLKDFLIK